MADRQQTPDRHIKCQEQSISTWALTRTKSMAQATITKKRAQFNAQFRNRKRQTPWNLNSRPHYEGSNLSYTTMNCLLSFKEVSIPFRPCEKRRKSYRINYFLSSTIGQPRRQFLARILPLIFFLSGETSCYFISSLVALYHLGKSQSYACNFHRHSLMTAGSDYVMTITKLSLNIRIGCLSISCLS